MKRTVSFASIAVVSAIHIQSTLGFSLVAHPPPRVKDTNVAVDGKATVAIAPPPQESAISSHDVTLTNYMRLPVEQYVLIPMPLGSSLTRIEAKEEDEDTAFSPSNAAAAGVTEFELVVPTITFFKLSLTPVVYATVQPKENRVVISSSKCILNGSPFIEKVNLNDRFDFTVNTTLTWEDACSQRNEATGTDPSGCMDGVIDGNSMEYSITAETCIKVDVDVPRPFSAFPKRAMEQTGNAAVKLTLKYIQANFVENLAKDYNKWATDLEYRQYRASLSEKVIVEEEDLLVEVGE